jgi:uncharacterized protein GlcG (DUF336 family)
MLEMKTIGLEEAKAAADAAIKANPLGERPIAVAVVSRTGELIYFIRQNGAETVEIRGAINKAYTAAIWKSFTADLLEMLKRRGRDFSWYGGDPQRETVLPGGAPIKTANGIVVGGIGISGKRGEDGKDTIKDSELAVIGAKAAIGC